MHITIHDVDHGFCALVKCPNGARYMIDCGRARRPGWSPSVHYAGTAIDLLVLQNLDEDHVEDLSDLLRTVTVRSIFSNPTVTANALASMKPDGMRTGVSTAHNVLRDFGPGLIGRWPDTGEVEVVHFYCRFGTHFTETNDLSLATFFRWANFTILFGGDLETAGWQMMLRNQEFQRLLVGTRVFVTSHHGRENGKCAELFQIMRPDIAVISDDAIQYGTQEKSTQWYRGRVKGIPVLGTENAYGIRDKRHVLTTRRDGTISIAVGAWGNYLVTPEKVQNELTLGEILGTFGRNALSKDSQVA